MPFRCTCLPSKVYTLDSVPPTGQLVLIRRNANLSTGGTATDVTELVHPEVAARAIEAARMVGLDVAGVDVVCEDIRPSAGRARRRDRRSQRRSRACGCTCSPPVGQPRPVGEAIVSTMFADGQNGRIPVVSVTGVNGKTTTTRLIAHIVRQTGRRVGMTCTEGIYHRRSPLGNRRLQRSAKRAEAADESDRSMPCVFETARGGILRAGLAFDRCDVAVVTNIGEGDHLGLNDIETLDKLARVKRVPVEAVSQRRHGRAERRRSAGGGNGEVLPGQRVVLRHRSGEPGASSSIALPADEP